MVDNYSGRVRSKLARKNVVVLSDIWGSFEVNNHVILSSNDELLERKLREQIVGSIQGWDLLQLRDG